MTLMYAKHEKIPMKVSLKLFILAHQVSTTIKFERCGQEEDSTSENNLFKWLLHCSFVGLCLGLGLCTEQH